MNIHFLNLILSMVAVVAIIALGLALLVLDVLPSLSGWRRYILVLVLFSYAAIRFFRARKLFFKDKTNV